MPFYLFGLIEFRSNLWKQWYNVFVNMICIRAILKFGLNTVFVFEKKKTIRNKVIHDQKTVTN